MMNGNKKVLGFAIAAATFATIQLYYNKKNINQINKPTTATEQQLRNRLDEFFTDESLLKAQGKYDTLVKMGINGRDAYRLLGCAE